MRFSLISSFALLSAVCTSSPVPEDFSLEARAVPANLPFNIIYAFTAQLTLGAVPKTATTNPIPLLGGAGPSNGILVPSPIIKGIVSGPLLNATITNGFAIPGVYNTTAGVYQTPLTNAYGVTSDGAELYIYQSGVGPQVGQTTRIVSWPPHFRRCGSKY